MLCRYGCWISTPTVIHRRDLLMREGGQIPELGPFGDTFAALVVALRYGVCYIPEPLTCWRQMATGHASRASWEELLERRSHAMNLMRTTYRDLFPMDYVDDFGRHWMYMVSITAGKCARREQEQVLTQVLTALCPEPSFLDRAFWLGMHLSMWAQAIAWRLYSMAKFAPWRWWILGRLSIIINLRKLKIIERLDT